MMRLVAEGPPEMYPVPSPDPDTAPGETAETWEVREEGVGGSVNIFHSNRRRARVSRWFTAQILSITGLFFSTEWARIT